MFRKGLVTIFCLTAGLHAEYVAKNYDHVLQHTRGFEIEALKTHLKLYHGYVKNTNILDQKIAQMQSDGQMGRPEFAAVQRIRGWEFDGMRLHELYFDALDPKPIQESFAIFHALEEQFGSFAKWKEQFFATGKMRGIGWVVLYRDRENGQLRNMWINEHDVGHLANADPLLIMDVFEHAYMLQFGLNRQEYLEVFFQNINWEVVEGRLKSLNR